MGKWYLLAWGMIFAGLVTGISPLTGLGIVAVPAVFLLHIGFSYAGIGPEDTPPDVRRPD